MEMRCCGGTWTGADPQDGTHRIGAIHCLNALQRLRHPGISIREPRIRMAVTALTTAQMAEVDRIMVEEYGIGLIQMMENAGRNLAEAARRLLDGQLIDRRIVVLCGAGNNGGGGMVAARHLHNRGAAVQVIGAGHLSRSGGAPAAHLKEMPAYQMAHLAGHGPDHETRG